MRTLAKGFALILTVTCFCFAANSASKKGKYQIWLIPFERNYVVPVTEADIEQKATRKVFSSDQVFDKLFSDIKAMQEIKSMNDPAIDIRMKIKRISDGSTVLVNRDKTFVFESKGLGVQSEIVEKILKATEKKK